MRRSQTAFLYVHLFTLKWPHLSVLTWDPARLGQRWLVVIGQAVHVLLPEGKGRRRATVVQRRHVEGVVVLSLLFHEEGGGEFCAQVGGLAVVVEHQEVGRVLKRR